MVKIHDIYTCLGMDVSPSIEIQGLNATSMAVIFEDPDAPSATFTHWLIWNIPPVDVNPKAIAKNATINEPFRALQGTNDFGGIGYAGPCPPSGKPHRYFFYKSSVL
jgi:Raf kinase inhibitor-like YbhB/YbcL family protein